MKIGDLAYITSGTIYKENIGRVVEIKNMMDHPSLGPLIQCYCPSYIKTTIVKNTGEQAGYMEAKVFWVKEHWLTVISAPHEEPTK